MLTRSVQRGLTLFSVAALLTSSAMAKPEVRDPFVNQKAPLASSARPAPAVRPHQAILAPASSALPSAGQAAGPLVPLDKLVVMPEVVVSGIVSAHGSRQAILTDGQKSYVVREGQRLADFRVKAISASSVVLDYEGQSFTVSMARRS